MEENVIIKRQKATPEVYEEIYRVIRNIAKTLPKEQAKKLFYTEEEIEKIKNLKESE